MARGRGFVVPGHQVGPARTARSAAHSRARAGGAGAFTQKRYVLTDSLRMPLQRHGLASAERLAMSPPTAIILRG